MKQEPVAVTGVWLLAIGDYSIAKVEVNEQWIEVIREHKEGAYSHIIEPTGIRKKVTRIGTQT